MAILPWGQFLPQTFYKPFQQGFVKVVQTRNGGKGAGRGAPGLSFPSGRISAAPKTRGLRDPGAAGEKNLTLEFFPKVGTISARFAAFLQLFPEPGIHRNLAIPSWMRFSRKGDLHVP
jgi:hypothetical protein